MQTDSPVSRNCTPNRAMQTDSKGSRRLRARRRAATAVQQQRLNPQQQQPSGSAPHVGGGGAAAHAARPPAAPAPSDTRSAAAATPPYDPSGGGGPGFGPGGGEGDALFPNEGRVGPGTDDLASALKGHQQHFVTLPSAGGGGGGAASAVPPPSPGDVASCEQGGHNLRRPGGQMGPPAPLPPQHAQRGAGDHPAHGQQQLQPHQPHQRGVPALMQAAPSGLGAPGPSILSLLSPTRGGGGEGGGLDGALLGEGGDEAISRRTRSKRPLGPAVELDPSELDRLLAEFDPDVEPLLDDDVYRQFLQVGAGVC
jgi:hypothetical protein